MNIIKTAALSFVSTVVKMLSALIINKFVSIYIGPSGIAMIGQFQNLIQLSNTFGQGGILSGITKYTAEYNLYSSNELNILWSTGFKIIVFLSLVCGFFLIMLSSYISVFLFGVVDYKFYIQLLGFFTILTSLNSFVLSILNGLKKIKLYVAINIYQSIISLIISVTFVFYLNIRGALLALTFNQSVVFLTLLVILFRYNGRSLIQRVTAKFSNSESKKLLSFSMMAITSAIVGPLSLMLIRGFITQNLTIEASGYWQSMWYISSMYLLVITTTLSIYYLPRLSEIIDSNELKNEIINGLKIIIPLVSLVSLCVYLLRDVVISILFTQEFYEMRELFKWQVCGDIIKIAAWLFSYVLISKAASKSFIVLEVINFSLFTLLSILMIHYYGLVGGSYAYFISNLVYLFFVSIVVYVRFLKNRSQ